MKHDLHRKEHYIPPIHHVEIIALRNLITQNWWNNGFQTYFEFSKRCKTSVGFMATELAETIQSYQLGKLSLESVTNKFRSILDLLDYYSLQKK